MIDRQSDTFIVVLNQGNAWGAKGGTLNRRF